MSTFFATLLIFIPVCHSASLTSLIPTPAPVSQPPLYFPDINVYKCDLENTCTDYDYSGLQILYFGQNNVTKVFSINEPEALLNDKDVSLNDLYWYFLEFADAFDTTAGRFVRKAYLKNGLSLLMLNTVPLTYCSSDILGSFTRAVKHAPCIGKIFAQYLCSLIRGGIDVGKIHVAGHGLGAHIAGIAGQQLQKTCSAILSAIHGLDPLSVCFDRADMDNQLTRDDAVYVQIMNSNRNRVGTNHDSLATANIVLNYDGYFQQQCGSNDACAHYLPVVVYVNSLSGVRQFTTKCSSWFDYKNGLCRGNDNQLIGFRCSNTLQGTYYFATNETVVSGEVYDTAIKWNQLVGASFE